MKFLALLFFAGIALAAAIPLSFHENAVEYPLEDFEEFVLQADDDVKTELGKKLKEQLDHILEKIKETIESGKGFREDYIEKAKEIRQKLKDLKVDLGDKAKELIEKLREKAKDYWQKILDRLRPQDSVAFADDDDTSEIGRKLKERLDEILNKIKDAIENGKGLKEDYIEKAKEIRQKLKDLRIDLGDRAKELIERLKEKAKDYWQKILDRLRPQESTLSADDEDIKTGLQNRFNELLEKIRDAFENRKIVKSDVIQKLKDIREKMKNLNVDIGGKAKELIERLKEKASSFWRRILDRLHPSKRAAVDFDNDDIKTELGKKLKERFDEILEKVKDAIENGKVVKEDTLEKLREIREKLRDLKVDLGNRAKELIAQLKEKAKDYWQKILDKLSGKDKREEPKTELGKRLSKDFDEILEKLKEAIENGKEIREEVLDKLKNIRSQLKDLRVDLSNRAKTLLQDLKAKAKDYWNKLLERLKIDKRSLEVTQFSDDDIKTELGKKLRERFDEILEKVKDAIENGKVVKEDTLEKLREIRGKLKDLKVDLGNRAKELIAQLKEKAKDYWQKILDKLSGKEKREVAQAESIFEIFNKLKNLLKSKLDADQLKEKVEKLFGKGSEFANQLINALKEKGEKGKGKILDWIDRILGDKETRSIKEVFDRIKNYFKDLNIELKERFVKFGEWVKENYGKGLEKGKTRLENIREIAQKFIDDTRDGVRNVAEEAIVFLRPYKEDLGELYDQVKAKVRDLLKREKEERSIKEVFDRIKNYFKDLNIELKERFVKFGEWVKENYGKGLEKGKTRLENIREIAQKFIDDTRDGVRNVAEEAIVFLRPYKEDLGELYDQVKAKVRELLKREKEERSIKEVYERIKNYFKDLNIELKERFVKFGEWVKEQYGKGLEKGKTRLENIREIAQRFIDDTRDGVRNVAEEAIVFLRPYKEDLGELYDQVKAKVRDLLKREKEERSIKEVFEKIKNYFKDLNIELKEKFSKFGEWAKEQFEKGLEKGKTKADNIKKIADEFIKDSKRVSKEVAEEALEFFREYKEDLGRVFDDIREKVKEVVNRKN